MGEILAERLGYRFCERFGEEQCKKGWQVRLNISILQEFFKHVSIQVCFRHASRELQESLNMALLPSPDEGLRMVYNR